MTSALVEGIGYGIEQVLFRRYLSVVIHRKLQ